MKHAKKCTNACPIVTYMFI